jgi:ABC-2 type transport system permease protein
LRKKENTLRKTLAIIRASWLTALSYRVDTFFSFAGLIVAVVPLYFVSGALQPMMAGTIKAEAPEYFGFLIVGIISYTFIQTAVGALPGALSGEISTGSFEALMSTPTPLVSLLAGMVGQPFSMTALRAVMLVLCAALFGAHVVWTSGAIAILIVFLIVLSYLPFGIMAGALILAFRTTGPFPTAILTLSALLGGVYYPTHVIPSWLNGVSVVVPLTYGLRSLRRTLLDGAPLWMSAGDLTVLASSTIVLAAISLVAFSWALRYAKRAGTLAQY